MVGLCAMSYVHTRPTFRILDQNITRLLALDILVLKSEIWTICPDSGSHSKSRVNLNLKGAESRQVCISNARLLYNFRVSFLALGAIYK